MKTQSFNPRNQLLKNFKKKSKKKKNKKQNFSFVLGKRENKINNESKNS
jgi:hypothetical protein